MNKLTRFFVLTLVIMALLVGCGQSDSGPSITTDEVLLETSNMDVHFSHGRPFSQTYMIFGGGENKHGDAFSKVTLCGLDIDTARAIHSRYPDFHMCKSPGAPLAQKAVRDLDIVPADSQVTKVLRKTLAEHQASLGESDKRVCVRLEGEVLKLSSVIVREANEDITAQLPPQVHHEYFLVKSAEITDFK